MAATGRPASPEDVDAVAALAATLWPEGSVADHRAHLAAIVAGTPPSTLPLSLFVADDDAGGGGFVGVGPRSPDKGCGGRRPVGFVEGWFVALEHRARGVGAALMGAAEAWAVG